MSGIFPYNLQWVVLAVNKCNPNIENKCVGKIKLRNAFTDPLQFFLNHYEPKAHRDFCDFFTFVPFTSSAINYYLSYDIIWCFILFSIHYRQFNVKKNGIQRNTRGTCGEFITRTPKLQTVAEKCSKVFDLPRLSLNFNTCIIVASCFYT